MSGAVMIKFLLLFLFLTACGALPLGMLAGGGPNVAANVQAGKENTQQVVANQQKTEAGRDIVTTTKQIEAASVESVTINNVEDIPIWLWIALVVGWVLPSPSEIARSIVDLFRRKK
jgi:predicted DCC family thiol-disulfide oxidoreductase YuxK